jgi:hypothetical protein
MSVDEYAIPYGTLVLGDTNVSLHTTRLFAPSQTWQPLSSVAPLIQLEDHPLPQGLVQAISRILDSGFAHMEYSAARGMALVRLYFLPSDCPQVRSARKRVDSAYITRLSRDFSIVLKHTSTERTLWEGDLVSLSELGYIDEVSIFSSSLVLFML